MDEPGFSTDSGSSEDPLFAVGHILIWGLGLMGGSLAMALRGKCSGLVGVDRDPAVIRHAQLLGIVDAAYTVEELIAEPEKLLQNVGCIVLAAPVRAILSILSGLPGLCAHPAVIMDLGSTKEQVIWAMGGLPERFDPVGGHPMCGKEKASLAYAEAAVYQNAPFALVPLPRTSLFARKLAESLARAVGANPIWLDAAVHDRWVAATSHLPFLVSSALAFATPEEARSLVGTGFRSTARLANSSPRMMTDILATNARNIQAAIQRFKERLSLYEALLEQQDFEGLEEAFNDAGEQYRCLLGQ
jgi:prephenate dehydrogenase